MPKRIKDKYGCLDSLLGKEMICQPSVVKHLKGGHIQAFASWWDLDLKETKIFKRRKLLRLCRKFKRMVKNLDNDCVRIQHLSAKHYVEVQYG